jgi:TRAP transporter TAXI family solute receptor
MTFARLKAALAAVAVAGLAGAAPAAAQTYGFVTMQPGTLNNSTGAAIAKVMQQKAGMQTRIQPTAGESALLPLVNSGEADFGIANILEAIEAYTGKAVAGKQDKLRVVAAVQPLRVAFFARKDSELKTLADVKGKRFPLGFSAMRTNDDLAIASLAAVGLTAKDVRPVMVPNVVRSADDFMNGSADVFYFALGAGKVNEADASVGGLRMLTLPNTPEALAAARKIAPPVYFTDVKPRPGLAGVLEPGTVLTFDNLLLAGAHVKNDAVEKVLTQMVQNKAEMAGAAPWLMEFGPADYYKTSVIPYHPGAVAFYEKQGLKPKE